jgi:hypothetical protein
MTTLEVRAHFRSLPVPVIGLLSVACTNARFCVLLVAGEDGT